MTNIAIVEDNDAEAQALADGIKRFMDGAKEKYALRRFDNAEAFLENLAAFLHSRNQIDAPFHFAFSEQFHFGLPGF